LGGADGPVDAGTGPVEDAATLMLMDGGAPISDASIAPLDSGCPPGTSTVRIRGVAGYEGPSGTTTAPLALPHLKALAPLPNGGGAFQSIPSTTLSPSLMELRCVPDGQFYLYENDYYAVVTASRAITLSRWNPGRADQVAATASTSLRFDVTGLPSGSEVQMATPAEWQDWYHIPAGTSEFRESAPLSIALDAARGDRVELLALASTTASAAYARSVFVSPPLSTVNGAETLVSGAFGAPWLVQPIRIDLRLTEFAQQTDALPPAHQSTFSLIAAVLPEGATHYAPNAFSLGLAFGGAGGQPIADLDVMLPLVIPSAGEKLLLDLFWIDYPPLGAVGGIGHLLLAPLDPLAPGPIVVRPRIGTALHLQLNGRDASQPLTDVGTGPIVTWDPPAFGRPTHYEVEFLPQSDGLTTPPLEFLTEEPPLVIPVGSLTAGQPLVMLVRAVERDPWVFATLEHAESIAATATFTP
jgi:hypothetical protein